MAVARDKGRRVRSDFWKLRCRYRGPRRGKPLSCQAGEGASPFSKHTQMGVGGDPSTVVRFTVNTQLREGDSSHQGTQFLHAKLSFTSEIQHCCTSSYPGERIPDLCFR